MTGSNFRKIVPGMYPPSILLSLEVSKQKTIIIIALKYLVWKTSLLQEMFLLVNESVLPNPDMSSKDGVPPVPTRK